MSRPARLPARLGTGSGVTAHHFIANVGGVAKWGRTARLGPRASLTAAPACAIRAVRTWARARVSPNRLSDHRFTDILRCIARCSRHGHKAKDQHRQDTRTNHRRPTQREHFGDIVRALLEY